MELVLEGLLSTGPTPSSFLGFRFAKNKLLTSEKNVTVMIQLHLAHGKEMEMEINRKFEFK